MIKNLRRAISFFISGIFAISSSTSLAVKQDFSEFKKNPDYRMSISQETTNRLINTQLNSEVSYSFGGFDYKALYAGKENVSGRWQFFYANIELTGPSSPNTSKNPSEFTIVNIAPPSPSQAGNGTNPAINAPQKSASNTITQNGSGTGNGSGANPGSGSRNTIGQNTNGNNKGNGNNGSNEKQPGFGDGFGDSLGKGLESGLSAGLATAFQDYVILTPGSQKELEQKKREYQAAEAKAAQAYSDYVLENKIGSKEIELKLNTLRNNLDALKTSQVSFERYLDSLNSNEASAANELEKILDHALNQPAVRPSFKKSVEDTLKLFEKAPGSHTATQKDFKNIAASALSAAAQSELLLEHEVADVNLEMARTSLDVLYGLDPYTGVHRDLYELMTGKNIITGETLSDFERALSGVGVAGAFVSGGISSSFSNGLKATYRAVKNSDSVMRAMKITEHSRTILNTLKDLRIPVQSGISKITSTLKKQAKRLGDLTLSDTKHTTEKLINDSIQTGKISSLPPLPPKALRNPHSTESLARIQEVVSDGIRITKKNILPGTNGKISLIGRPMSVVKEQGLRLQKEGFDVELFDAEWMDKLGRPSPISQAASQGYAKTIRKIQDGIISDPYNALKDLPLYTENKIWIQQKIRDGNTIIDIGDNSGNSFSSPFYDIEIEFFEHARGIQ